MRAHRAHMPLDFRECDKTGTEAEATGKRRRKMESVTNLKEVEAAIRARTTSAPPQRDAGPHAPVVHAFHLDEAFA